MIFNLKLNYRVKRQTEVYVDCYRTGNLDMYNPKWSKAKKQLQGYICESLKDRIDFHIINYRKAHDQLGRAVITVDKKEVLNMCTITSDIALIRKERDIRRNQNIEYDVYNQNQNYEIGVQAHNLIKAEGIFAQYDFFDSLEQYFNSSIEKSLVSTDMVVKILSLIDRRIGKRTLEKLNESIKSESDIIKYFYQLRCDAEGLNLSIG